jgi:hypothetical protein
VILAWDRDELERDAQINLRNPRKLDRQISLRNPRKLDCAGNTAQRPVFPHSDLAATILADFPQRAERSDTVHCPGRFARSI